jgi:hypothetical protein
LWDVLMEAVQWSGKNQQQNSNAALRQVVCWTFVFFASLRAGHWIPNINSCLMYDYYLFWYLKNLI